MTIGSLFSGIGGFDLGLEQAGLGPVKWQVEIDPSCRRVLERHWPNVHREEDITRCGFTQLEEVEIICGGFPCQDLSIAGKRKGLEGKRSNLFYEMTRIIDAIRPAFVVWENVPGLLNSDNGRDMLRVLREFHRIGYHGAWRCFDARYFGLAQRRRRVFGVFARGNIGAGRCAEILSLPAGMSWHPAPRREAGKGIAADIAPCLAASGRGTERTGESREQDPVIAVTHTLRAEGHDASEDGTGRGVPLVCASVTSKWAKGSGGPAGDEAQNLVPVQVQWASGGGKVENDTAQTLRSGAEHSYQFIRNNLSVRRLTPTECERLQGFPDGWTAGESDSARYRMLGNAVAVPVARWIGERIKGQ